MTPKVLNTIGLIIGILGVLLIFVYGPPQPDFKEGISLVVEDATPIDSSGKTAAQHDEEIRIEKERYNRNSKIGLAFIMIGFAFQLVAVWRPQKKQ